MYGAADGVRYARRLAREKSFRGRREYVHVGCGKNLPVFHAPGKTFHDRSAAWLAAGMVAAGLLISGSCLAAVGTWQSGARTAASTGPEAAAADAPTTETRGSAESFDLGQLMKLLGQRKEGKVSYEQEDYFAILDQPVPSSGVLIYRAPDRLEKRTLRPKAASLVVEGDELTVQRGKRTYRMQLSAYPQVAPLVDAMRDTLAGDEEGLERVFKVTLTGTLQNWKLRLVPLDKEVARKVSAVEMAGKRDEIRSVEILQVGGDRSVMTLGPPPAGAAGTDPAPAPP
jgi:hypothetical protein